MNPRRLLKRGLEDPWASSARFVFISRGARRDGGFTGKPRWMWSPLCGCSRPRSRCCPSSGRTYWCGRSLAGRCGALRSVWWRQQLRVGGKKIGITLEIELSFWLDIGMGRSMIRFLGPNTVLTLDSFDWLLNKLIVVKQPVHDNIVNTHGWVRWRRTCQSGRWCGSRCLACREFPDAGAGPRASKWCDRPSPWRRNRTKPNERSGKSGKTKREPEDNGAKDRSIDSVSGWLMQSLSKKPGETNTVMTSQSQIQFKIGYGNG